MTQEGVKSYAESMSTLCDRMSPSRTYFIVTFAADKRLTNKNYKKK